MRAVVLLSMVFLLPSVRTAEAQELGTSPVTLPLAALTPAPGTAVVSASASVPFAPAKRDVERRDHGKGALIGLGVGALAGGVGFAAMNYAFTTSGPRDEYALLSFMLGGAVGGVAGAVVGGIIGTPERQEPRREQVRLHLSPDLSRGGMAAISVSF
ncbi:MAG TPA: hypothetical protein VGB24_12015 [Longimicrobium sp.]|uniref:hypothetical protein n=1 Tax=Longimicrobium sp. TaxID=2029185 RepID=UPI002ED9D985